MSQRDKGYFCLRNEKGSDRLSEIFISFILFKINLHNTRCQFITKDQSLFPKQHKGDYTRETLLWKMSPQLILSPKFERVEEVAWGEHGITSFLDTILVTSQIS